MKRIKPNSGSDPARTGPARAGRKVFVTIMWTLVIALVCISAVILMRHRADINADFILRLVPDDPWLAILMMLGFFVLKALTIVFDMRILYIASGLLFPLPAALAVNVVGTALEATVPYLEGRAGGGKLLMLLMKRWPQLQRVRALRMKNSYLFALLLRAVGVLADPVGMYFGASRMPFVQTLLGSVTGMLPVLLLTTVMGETIRQPESPLFILSTALFIAFEVCAISGFAAWSRKVNGKRERKPAKGETLE